jgi:DUF4097 and DUF4098 domain-containing protein YvlB
MRSFRPAVSEIFDDFRIPPQLAFSRISFVIVLLPIFACVTVPQVKGETGRPAMNTKSRLEPDLTGTVINRGNFHRLHVSCDFGNILIHTTDSGDVAYRVYLKANGSGEKVKPHLLKGYRLFARSAADGVHIKSQTPNQESERLWVKLEVSLPKDYSVDAVTGGGNIEIEDLSGGANLSTAGGNITAGNIGAAAHLETNGGHITVKDVSGDLFAKTGGGHITIGAIAGGATLRTSGGHIHAFSVGGIGDMVTRGGNITVEHSGGQLLAQTSGGRIEVGEAAGLVHAKTDGGGIHIVRVSGPSDLQTGGGNIYLTQVDSAVKASTMSGGITAWFVAPLKQPGNCELRSSAGDIVVYLPRRLPMTIDAQIQMADDHRVIVDPAFPLRLTSGDSSSGPRIIRAEGSLNGGGEILRLRAVEGNIRLVVSDTNRQVQIYNQQMDELQQQLRQLRLQLRNLITLQDGYDNPSH